MHFAVRIAALMGLLLSVGCVKVRSSYALLNPPKEAYSGDVSLISEGQAIPQGLHEIALVQAYGIKPDGDEDKVRKRLIAQAGALGCSVVADVHVDRSAGSTAMSGVCLAR